MIAIAGALSVFRCSFFVWVAFGGPTPLAARGYEVKLPLTQVGQLPEQSEVDISEPRLAGSSRSTSVKAMKRARRL